MEKRNAADRGFTTWTLNGQPYSISANQQAIPVQRGKRYRLYLHNSTKDMHPVHGHIVEVAAIAGTPTAGMFEDVVMLGDYQKLDLGFVADQSGLSLLHGRQQLHMNYGFMTLLNRP
ncbi:multicopper oxidase domain-containing protein [Amycolatopsis sp. NBC_01480]|uniref:multicopper oxidase domain-containing protein n=1 Tax=Amycolatopsis sp. NBC_01480 TaxID=2903562 RepID=UPI002E2D3CA3|nr:multicopper oxidase domain-containing protein [Amycolatopsis sp. NBC_01480]